MRALAAAIALTLITITTPVLAASPKVEAAIKVFRVVGAAPDKLKTFCEMMKIDEQMGEKDDPILHAQIDKLIDLLGADFEAAWDLVESTKEETPDGKVLYAALDQLVAKCPK